MSSFTTAQIADIVKQILAAQSGGLPSDYSPAGSNQSVIQLGGAGKSSLMIRKNPARRGLLLFNPNDGIILPSAPLQLALNTDLPGNYCIPLQANEKWFMDFVTPYDSIYVQSTVAGAYAGYIEFM